MEKKELNVVDAFNTLAGVVRTFKGSADEHDHIKACLEKVAEFVTKGLEADKVTDEPKDVE